LAVAIFITQCPFTFSVIVSGPMTAVSFVGGSVRMGCTRDLSSDAVDWEFAPADTNKTSYIYTNRQIRANLTSRYRIDTDRQTRYDLIIDPVVWSDAGTYVHMHAYQPRSISSIRLSSAHGSGYKFV